MLKEKNVNISLSSCKTISNWFKLMKKLTALENLSTVCCKYTVCMYTVSIHCVLDKYNHLLFHAYEAKPPTWKAIS